MGMNVNIDLKEWKLREVDDVKKIAGEFVIKAGATEIATQSFNGDSYSNTVTIPFSTQLTLDIEKITARIVEEIRCNFTGEKAA